MALPSVGAAGCSASQNSTTLSPSLVAGGGGQSLRDLDALMTGGGLATMVPVFRALETVLMGNSVQKTYKISYKQIDH